MTRYFVILMALAAFAAQADTLDHPANARLKEVLDKVRNPPREVAVLPAIQNVREVIVWPRLHATTWRAGKRCSGGPTSPKSLAIALPHFEYLGKKVLIRSRKTGKVIEVETRDTGPWSRFDAFIHEGRRPWSESGRSDTYKRTRNPAGVDLTAGVWLALGHGRINPDTYSGEVDLLVPVAEIPSNTIGD